jgi:hypothetical protein
VNRYALCFLLVPGATAVADDWPQWQGPDRNAVSKETGLLKVWPKDGPSVAWKANGLGAATPPRPSRAGGTTAWATGAGMRSSGA